MKIGMVGIALSHPYTFADIMHNRGVEQFYAWDADADRLQTFCAANAKATPCASFAELLNQPLDGAMVCTESHLHARYAVPLIQKGVPTFVDKVMAINDQQLREIEDAVAVSNTPCFSSSILRFSPKFLALGQLVSETPRHQVLFGAASVRHSIEGYFKPGNTWQDEVDKGGGTLQNMGVHGIELLYAIFGGGVEKVLASTTTVHYTQTRSEDTAVIQLKYRDGRLAVVNLVCGANHNGYQMDVYLHQGLHTVCVPAPGTPATLEDYGYEGLVDAFLSMVSTKQSPMPFEETTEIMRVLHAARASVEAECWVEVHQR